LVAELEAARALVREHGGDGYAAAEALAERQDIGLDARLFEGEERTGAADSGLHFVADEQELMAIAERAECS